MGRYAGLALVALAVLAVSESAAQEERDRYGGWRAGAKAATGWFRTARSGGRWWLVDPEGHRFISVGVNAVSFRPDTIEGTNRSPYREAAAAKYGNQFAWAKAVVQRLRGWGFNTLGGGSDPVLRGEGMPYVVLLDLSGAIDWGEGKTFPDVFDPVYEAAVRRRAARACRPLVRDRLLIGYFTDGELRWGPDERSQETLFAEFLGRDDGEAGRREVLRFLERRYLNVDELNAAWGTSYRSFGEVGRTPQVGSRIPQGDIDGFLRLAAERYFRIVGEAVREVDEHHLVLGPRFAGAPEGPVLEAMGDGVDVVSVNDYGAVPPRELLREIHRTTEKPVLMSAFSSRARGSGAPGGVGRGPAAEMPGERAAGYEQYVSGLIGLPMVVGYHWERHADRPVEGGVRAGERNCGLVDIRDEPYRSLVEAAARVNGMVYGLAAREE
jgi:agarase